MWRTRLLVLIGSAANAIFGAHRMCGERDPSVGANLFAIQCAALAKMVSPAFSKDGGDTLLPARSEVWEGACSRQGRRIQLMLRRAD
jgi:hypothetical protein